MFLWKIEKKKPDAKSSPTSSFHVNTAMDVRHITYMTCNNQAFQSHLTHGLYNSAAVIIILIHAPLLFHYHLLPIKFKLAFQFLFNSCSFSTFFVINIHVFSQFSNYSYSLINSYKILTSFNVTVYTILLLKFRHV